VSFLVLLLMAALAADDVDALLREGRVGEAIPVAEEAARGNPNDVEAQETWIDLMLSLGHPSIIAVHYAERANLAPEDPLAHYLFGRASVDPSISLAAYEKALELDPKFARAHMGVAAVYKVAGKLDEAAKSYRMALDLDGSLGEAWGSMLAIYVNAGRRDEALELAEIAMLLVPDLAEPYLVYAALKPELAEATLRKAVARVPPDARIWSALSEMLLDAGMGAEALGAADEAIRLNATLPGPRLAKLFAESMVAGTLDAAGYDALVTAHDQERDNPTVALATYDTLVRTYARSPLPWMSRARVRALTDVDGAKADLERALALDPGNPEATAALGVLLAEREPAKALPLLEPIAKERPYDASLQVAYGKAALASGKAQEALGRLHAAEQLHPYDVDVALQKALALSATGDREAAYQTLATAAGRIADVRITIARAAAAKESGRIDEAYEIYAALYERTGKEFFQRAAAHMAKLRGD
jgi:tetratricopeptide (TPR) repeat protein